MTLAGLVGQQEYFGVAAVAITKSISNRLCVLSELVGPVSPPRFA